MKIENYLQTEVIKGNRIYHHQFENTHFLTDGHIGVYLLDNELKIDPKKMCIITSDSVKNYDPEIILKERTAARVTNDAYKLIDGFAIKLKSKENDIECFVKNKYFKMFPDCTGIYIKSAVDPVLIYKNGLPYGIILPMRIYKD